MASSSKQVTVEDASPSPPPLPKEPLPNSAQPAPIDQPIESLGEDDESGEEESDEEWDPAAERGPEAVNGKEKGKEKDQSNGEDGQPWQAVWAPEQNGKLVHPLRDGALT